ncbi:MAG: hypothetical protein Q4F06_02950 [Eubacteriales bacterium]|nr:hypothetical protein [Eubacteriales bacterium]
MDVNVENIMQEIKNEIKAKGYSNDMLSFDDIIIDSSSMNVTKFDKIKFEENLYDANHEWQVNSYRMIQGNKVSVFFKKVLRKCMYFFVDPIVNSQNGFNASLVRMMNQMSCYIDEQNKEIEELKKRIDKLEGK